MKRLWLFTACAFLLSGNAFFLGGCESGQVAEDVQINGISVGGLEYEDAVARVRERLKEQIKPLTLTSPLGEVTVRYPQLSLLDDLPILVRLAAKGNSLTARTRRTWADAERVVEGLCEQNARAATDASMTFSAEGFTYTPEQVGKACDFARTMEIVTRALTDGTERVALEVNDYSPEITLEGLKAQTQLLSQFTTYFDGSNTPRVNNIRLSASRVSGTVLEVGEEFSFNGVVGLRTAENGYENATVIQNGVFVDGIGGGVCQTSTTLFNAALLAGMEISESRNHSLSIGYVPPSLDAMVSEYSDLKFINRTNNRVYLLTSVEDEGITVSFYGEKGDYTFQTESVTLAVIDPPPAEYVEGDREEVVRPEKQGLESESYLLCYDREGNLLERRLIRRDKYNTVQGIYQILPE